MDFKIRESYALVDNKIYIDSVEDRAKLLEDCGEEFYNHVLSLWDTIEDKMSYQEVLTELKNEKEYELNDKFKEAVSGSFTTTEGYKMQFNTDDSLKMFGAIQLLESNGLDTGYITDADDVTHYDIPIATMKSVQNQMLNRYAECHLLKQQYREAINNANSIEDLNEINILFN